MWLSERVYRENRSVEILIQHLKKSCYIPPSHNAISLQYTTLGNSITTSCFHYLPKIFCQESAHPGFSYSAVCFSQLVPDALCLVRNRTRSCCEAAHFHNCPRSKKILCCTAVQQTKPQALFLGSLHAKNLRGHPTTLAYMWGRPSLELFFLFFFFFWSLHIMLCRWSFPLVSQDIGPSI